MPAGAARIHPGVQTFTSGAQCTANFVFVQGSTVYIGQAAHCSSTGAQTDTNGCSTHTLPPGTTIQVGGASQPGTMVYNSWATMQALGETDPSTCQFNDLALVQLTPTDAANVNPSIPAWGGPTGVGPAVPSGGRVESYGNSELRGGVTAFSPTTGYSLLAEPSGWSTTVYTLTPGIPGDSGSAFLDGAGRAIGVLSTIAVLPLPASNGVGSIERELQYLHTHTSFGAVQLATGTEPFSGNPLRLLSALLH
jgi:hypothetical protein